jgi:hypothetical protein
LTVDNKLHQTNPKSFGVKGRDIMTSSNPSFDKPIENIEPVPVVEPVVVEPVTDQPDASSVDLADAGSADAGIGAIGAGVAGAALGAVVGGKVAGRAGAVLGAVVGAVAGGLTGKDAAVGVVDKVKDAAENAKPALENAKSKVQDAAENVKPALENAANKVKGAAENARGSFNQGTQSTESSQPDVNFSNEGRSLTDTYPSKAGEINSGYVIGTPTAQTSVPVEPEPTFGQSTPGTMGASPTSGQVDFSSQSGSGTGLYSETTDLQSPTLEQEDVIIYQEVVPTPVEVEDEIQHREVNLDPHSRDRIDENNIL